MPTKRKSNAKASDLPAIKRAVGGGGRRAASPADAGRDSIAGLGLDLATIATTVATGDLGVVHVRLIARLLMEVAELLALLLCNRSKKAGKRIPTEAQAELDDLIARLRKLGSM